MMRASFIVAAGFASTVAAIAGSVAGADYIGGGPLLCLNDCKAEVERGRICQYGYALSQRMSKQESMLKKGELMAAYCDAHHIDSCRFGDYELDHKLSLCLGGTNDKDNLQIQPWGEARKKDQVEVYLCRAVCHGTMDLKKAQSELVNDWQGAYGRYIHPH